MVHFKVLSISDQRMTKDMLKFYYAVKYRIPRLLLTVAAVLLLIFAFRLLSLDSTISGLVAAWAGVMLLVYPRLLYRRPYKQMKGLSQRVKYEFGDDSFCDIHSGEKSEYLYSQLAAVYELPLYIYLVSEDYEIAALRKEDIDELSAFTAFLKEKAGKKYKVRKRNFLL